jgi:hypothetical protein
MSNEGCVPGLVGAAVFYAVLIVAVYCVAVWYYRPQPIPQFRRIARRHSIAWIPQSSSDFAGQDG